jgi:fumarylacetoacetase
MPLEIDETHDPKLESWVESANDPGTDFPIQNLPVGENAAGEMVIRIGDSHLVLDELFYSESFMRQAPKVAHQVKELELPLYAISSAVAHEFRRYIQSALGTAASSGTRELIRAALRPASADGVGIHGIGDYTDFYASLHHATNVGSMFRPDNPILPNYKWMPIGYHGRASSIVPSGADVRRPRGQLLPGATIDDGPPQHGPCRMLDYELEVGAVIGRGNDLGRPIPIGEAEDHIFGLCLVNDWSARDIQKWEYQPLGPFLAKSFATTISPYIVTMEALAPFRTPAFTRPEGDPAPLPYLDSERNRAAGGFDLTLEVYLQSEQMRARNMDPIRLSRGSFKDMYWTLGQMVAHHTSNGCNLQPGDLLASGTVSGPTRDSRGCMLELTWDGDPWRPASEGGPVAAPTTQRTPIKLPTGEERKFLADGDEVIIRGSCEREGFRRIGFGECRGRIVPVE